MAVAYAPTGGIAAQVLRRTGGESIGSKGGFSVAGSATACRVSSTPFGWSPNGRPALWSRKLCKESAAKYRLSQISKSSLCASQLSPEDYDGGETNSRSEQPGPSSTENEHSDAALQSKALYMTVEELLQEASGMDQALSKGRANDLREPVGGLTAIGDAFREDALISVTITSDFLLQPHQPTSPTSKRQQLAERIQSVRIASSKDKRRVTQRVTRMSVTDLQPRMNIVMLHCNLKPCT